VSKEPGPTSLGLINRTLELPSLEAHNRPTVKLQTTSNLKRKTSTQWNECLRVKNVSH